MLWFGNPGALVALPDPDAGVRVTPERLAVEHRLLSGARVVDFAGDVRRVFACSWSRLSDDEHALLEQFHTGARGRGPFTLIPADARWNYLSAVQASATSLTGDTTGWRVTGGETLASVTGPVYRGPRALRWSLPANAASAVLHPVAPAGMSGWPTPPAVVWSWSLHAQSSDIGIERVRMALRFLDASGADLSGSPVTVEQPVSVTGFTRIAVTAPAPADTVFTLPGVYASTRPSAYDLYLDTPQLEIGTAPGSWLPGRGLPQVAFTTLTDTYPWVDTHDTTAVFTEVG